MPKRQNGSRTKCKAASAKGALYLGPLSTLHDCRDALNLLAKEAMKQTPGVDSAIRAVSASASVQIRATQLELAGANLQGDKDVHVTFNDLEPALKAAQEEIASLKARLEALEHPKPPSPPRPPSTNVQGTGTVN